jgi:hypothetical protein
MDMLGKRNCNGASQSQKDQWFTLSRKFVR